MRVLVVGRGPVARVLAVSVAGESHVTVGVRDGAGQWEVRASRLRSLWGRRRSEVRTVETIGVDALPTDWDFVICTAPVTDPVVAALLSRISAGSVLTSVSQVPSEVEALREIAGDRRWGIVVPEFLATTDDTGALWWQPGRTRFTVAGPAADTLRSVLFGSPRWARTAMLARPLVSAATMMPIVAGLQATEFDLTAFRRGLPPATAAANEARSAVAAAFGEDPPGSVSPTVVGAALRALPLIAPLDLQRYLREHFGGHTGQTLRMVDDWIELGNTHQVPTPELASLRCRLALSPSRQC